MQQTMSRIRRAIDDYDMINQNEKIAVALSGGKDSALMLAAMASLAKFHPKNFSVCAVYVDLGFGNIDIDRMKRFCDEYDVELGIKHTEISKIIFVNFKLLGVIIKNVLADHFLWTWKM